MVERYNVKGYIDLAFEPAGHFEQSPALYAFYREIKVAGFLWIGLATPKEDEPPSPVGSSNLFGFIDVFLRNRHRNQT